jgi:iron complex transport system ATP-binding protein
MEYFLNAKQMCVGYDGKPLIREITFSLRQGEILTLIGPNGAGKTTVLKSMAGQLPLLGGAVYLDGKDTSGMSGVQLSRQMAVVMTEKLKSELLTCRDVVGTGRYPYTGRFGILSQEDMRIVTEAMELVQVDAIADRDFTRISDGQRQRVMLARAIAQEPEILILDEPTSYLDVKYKLEFLSIVQELCRKKGLTVIMSLHELELAQRVSDRICCVKGAYVERFGTPEEIFMEGYLGTLFDIQKGSFDEAGSSMELAPVTGSPEVFVIAGAGSGRSVYRRLQRQGIPFATGILYDNDLDYPVAKALAVKTIVAKGFEPIPDALFAEAKQTMRQCTRVICCRDTFGSYERANEELLADAKRLGKIVS